MSDPRDEATRKVLCEAAQKSSERVGALAPGNRVVVVVTDASGDWVGVSSNTHHKDVLAILRSALTGDDIRFYDFPAEKEEREKQIPLEYSSAEYRYEPGHTPSRDERLSSELSRKNRQSYQTMRDAFFEVVRLARQEGMTPPREPLPATREAWDRLREWAEALLVELLPAMAKVEGAERVLFRWDTFDEEVRAAQRFLETTEEGSAISKRIDKVRKGIGGQP